MAVYQPLVGLLVVATFSVIHAFHVHAFEAIRYRNPGLVVDLGVGLWAWPLPMDFDEDGDFDLVVSCPDEPSDGVYLFENPGGDGK